MFFNQAKCTIFIAFKNVAFFGVELIMQDVVKQCIVRGNDEFYVTAARCDQ